MTLYAIIEKLKMLALKHPNVNSAYEGNIYDIMNANPEQKYASVVLTQQSHTQDDTYDHYGFNLFYVDRLVDDMEDNRVQIQSTGKSMLSNIIKAFCEEFDAECDTINYQTFTERFADECAGVYCTLVIDMVKDIYCVEQYWDETWATPLITVRNQNKYVQFTENGTYIVDYDAINYTGLGKVEVEVNVPDLNGSYDEGYEDGKNDGREESYNQGKQDGIAEGYSQGKTEGYNEGKVEGYTEGKEDGIEEGISNAGSIIAETAQVLNITENGTYVTKYSQPKDFGREVTGYFDDGTPFYDYAYLNDKVFKTDALVTKDSKIEVWWKPSNEWDNNYYGDGIVGTIEYDYPFVLKLTNGKTFTGSVWSSYEAKKEVELENKWYHLSYSYDEGLFVDGEYCGKQTSAPSSAPTAEYCYINLTKKLTNYTQANGYFGMVKVDDNIYIPTANGYINYITKQPLEVYQDGRYNFDGIPEFDGNLIRTVNVNITPKINIQKERITFSYSNMEQVPEWADWSNIQDMSYMFYYAFLKEIPFIDTSKVFTMEYMCAYNNITTFPLLDTSNVTNMYGMFSNCKKLITLPLLDTSNVTDFYNFVYNCERLTYFPPIDTSNATKLNNIFSGCKNLTSIPALNASKATNISTFFGYSDQKQITDFGGLVGLKINWNDNYGLVRVPNLTYESCINVLNGLYDFVGNGETPTSSQGKLKVHANFLTTVGDDLSIGTNKGWTITA